MQSNSKESILWKPLAWFIDGWQESRNKRTSGDETSQEQLNDPLAQSLLKAFFTEASPEPMWMTQLKQLENITFPDVLPHIVNCFVPHIHSALVNDSDLLILESFFRELYGYGIVVRHRLSHRPDDGQLDEFATQCNKRIHELGRKAAEKGPLSTSSVEPIVGSNLVIIGTHGEKLVRPLQGSSREEVINELTHVNFPSPRPQILFLSSGIQRGLLLIQGKEILTFRISTENLISLACSSTGRFNPVGQGVSDLLMQDNCFPFIGSLHGSTKEIENGVSWWRINHELTYLNEFDAYLC